MKSVCSCRYATQELCLSRLLLFNFTQSKNFLQTSSLHPSLTVFDKNTSLKGFMRCVKMVWAVTSVQQSPWVWEHAAPDPSLGPEL